MRRFFPLLIAALCLSVSGFAAADAPSVGARHAALIQSASPAQTQPDALRVTETLPADGASGVASDAAITVIFDRPVLPLGVEVNVPPALQDPLIFDPPVGGVGEWINTSIYLFRPDPALAGGTTYTIMVSSNVTAIDGSTQLTLFQWSFTTSAPQIASIEPLSGTAGVALDAPITVTFNQPMDRASVEAAFVLEGGELSSVPGTFAWDAADTAFTFTPDALLRLDNTYTVRFAQAQARGAGGGTPLAQDESILSFQTVVAPAIIETSPSDGQDNAPYYGGVTLYFASPMNLDTLDDKIIIVPEPWREYDSYYNEYDNSYTFAFPPEPSTNYTVTIQPGMEDVYGNRIDTPLTLQYTTESYTAAIALEAPYGVGFYNADNAETRVFMTHRNVSRVDLTLYRASTADFIAEATGDNSYDPSYALRSDDVIRQWSIDSIAPLNQRRYELLNLGAGGGAVDCPGAPATRLMVGDMAVVVSDPDPVRARREPPDGDIVTLLYRDYAAPIIGGPVCANSLIWWQLQLREGESGWVAEGIEGEYFLDVRDPAARQTIDVTAANGDALPPGVYLLTVSSPETNVNGNAPLKHALVVATANLMLKISRDTLTIWATDVTTNAPIPNAPIAVYDNDLNVVASGTTDADGLLTVPLPSERYAEFAAVLESDTDFGIGTTTWGDGIQGWSFGFPTDDFPSQYAGYLYTDRPIYRPGQPVYFRGVVRERKDVTYTPPAFTSVPVVILNDSFEVVYEAELPLTSFGTFSGTFTLADDAMLGSYRLEFPMPDEDPDSQWYNTALYFAVAEYRSPEFQVTVTPERAEIVNGETLRAVIDSRYFFGGAVGGATVEWRIVDAPYDFDGDPRYSFIDFDQDAGAMEFYAPDGGMIMEGVGTADAAGLFVVEFPTRLDDDSGSRAYTLEATVTDESAQAVSGRAQIVVHRGAVYVGVRPQNYVEIEDQAATVDLLTLDAFTRDPASATVDVEVVERRWYSVQERDNSGRTVWSYEVEDIPVSSGAVTTDADGRGTFSFTPPNGGVYKINVCVSGESACDTGVRASAYLWVAGTEYVAWRQQNSNRIDLIADSDSYNIGDTAQILIASPFQGTAMALITVERGDVLYTDVVTMDSNSFVYELPITDDFAPNIYISAMIVKGVDENNPVAAFRVGMVQVAVENARKEITLTITPDSEGAQPGETVTYTVLATDYAGNPVRAEVGVGLTDLAVLTLAPPNSDPLLNHFYGQQRLSVRTTTPLTINTDLLTQTVLDTIKGGGGGFGDGGIFDIREEFIDTPYWNATLTTDADGRATFAVTLPDNLTTWRLDARAVTDGADGNMLVGQTTVDLLSTKPVLIRPITPRFFVVGDQVILAALVNNNTDVDLSVNVNLEAAGVTFAGDAAQTVAVPAGGRARIEWNVTVEDGSAVDLTFFASANDGQYTDASKPPLGQGDARTLPVYRYSAPTTVATAGALDAAGTREEQIVLPPDVDIIRGELVVGIQTSLGATAIDALAVLEDQPYDCTEQVVSRFLPNLMTARTLAALGVANPDLERAAAIQVSIGIQKLAAQQKPNGGWGWCVQDAADPLVTAYALIGLAEARAQDYPVDDAVIMRATSYLRSTFVAPSLNIPAWQLDRQAFVLYALARSDQAAIARASALYDVRASLSLYAKALLAMTFDLSGVDDRSRIDTLLSDIFTDAIVSATGVHWEEAARDIYNWNTNTRTTAIILSALTRLNPDSDLLPNVVRWLVTARAADAWETTQETAWAVMALTDFVQISGGLDAEYDYSVGLNDAALALSPTPDQSPIYSSDVRIPIVDLLTDAANRLLFERGDGAGTLYYTAYLDVYQPVPAIEPLNAGIVVERRYTNAAGETVTSARVGELIQARLTIIAPNDLHYVVIDNPIPAGVDAVDPNLSTSQQIGTQSELNAADPLSQGWGWWWFSRIEFRDERVVLSAQYLPAGAYEFVYTIRPGLAGVYNVLPPTGREFYFPEVMGRGAGSAFTITP
ncbi:MAG: Ig-like domain-containing protein [Chloroflexota bacterium]|nr:Ig-like domain-containing protein [Chloroflexota bacterium]